MLVPANTRSYTVSCVSIAWLKEMTGANIIYEKAQLVPDLGVNGLYQGKTNEWDIQMWTEMSFFTAAAPTRQD